MSEQNIQSTQDEVSTGTSVAIYILYLVSFITGITAIIGVVMAYINKGSDNFLDTHYQFQIRTFWIGLLYGVIGVLTFAFVIGWFILLFTAIWLIIRCVKGLKFLNDKKPMPDPTSWLFG